MSDETAMTIINSAANRAAARAFAKPMVGGSRVVSDLPTWLQLQRVQGGLTPVEVSRRLAEADLGRMAPLVDLANALRQKDNHLQGILETRETAVQRLPWDLELPKKPTKREKKAYAFVIDALKGPLPAAVAHASSAPYYGYAVSETMWVKSNGYIVPDYFNPIAARRFRYVGNELFWDDQNGKPPVDIRAEYPSQFVISRPRVNGDVPCREGLMRVLVWAALFRNWTVTDWLRLGEIAWKPWRTGSYDKTKFAQQEEIDDLVDVIDAMSSSGVAVLPDSVKLNVEWPKGASSGSSHKDIFETMGREMSKSTLGQTETTESSTASGYAQAKVQYDVKQDKRDADAAFIGTDFTRDIVRVLILLNFGEGVRIPNLRAVTEEAEDLEPFGIGIKALKEAGTRIPAKWVRQKAGIPEPVEGEEIIGGAESDGTAGTKPPNAGGNPSDPNKNEG